MTRFVVESEFSSSPARTTPSSSSSVFANRGNSAAASNDRNQQSLAEAVPSRLLPPRLSSLRKGASFSLSCLSPDGRTMFSVRTNDGDDDNHNNVYTIEAHNLPLEGSTEEVIERGGLPAFIRTALPPTVTAILDVDAPLELLCVDGDHFSIMKPSASTATHYDEGRPHHWCPLPLLCLYTRHSVFLLELAFELDDDKETTRGNNGSTTTGKIISVTQPLESHLDCYGGGASIVRVRPAPQQRMGYAVLSPPGSLAVLVHYSNGAALNEQYALFLYHHHHGHRRHPHHYQTNNNIDKGWISKTLRFGMEQLSEDEGTIITDFCFAQSNGQALLATMSVLLLQASGHVLGASPVLFDGAVVPLSTVASGKDYLEYVIHREQEQQQQHQTTKQNEARVRQCKAALQFFRDAFPSPLDDTASGGNSFVTARTNVGGSDRSGGVMESSLVWPVQVQGPVVLSSSSLADEDWNAALTIEPFFSQDLVGMVIAREQISIDFAAIPATALLPRFEYMSPRDQDEVDCMLGDLGAVVERVAVMESSGNGEDEALDSRFISLIRDPIVDNMIHYASTAGVASITTNALRIYSNDIRSKAVGVDGGGLLSPLSSRKKETVRSMAWSSIDVSAGCTHISLSGAVVSGDALLGHTLVASLTNGSCAAINLTESRYLHESASLAQVQDPVEDETSRAASRALQAMESTPPFFEILEPLVDEVKQGLAGMGKIVGGKTAPKDIDPAMLATVIAVKERCEKEIILPLQEMDQLAASRLEQLKEMCKSQQQQMSALKETIQLLQDRVKTTGERMQVAESNSSLLAQRSCALLQASQDLRPTVTDAEAEYFSLLRRLQAKCVNWEETVGAVLSHSSDLCAVIDAGRATSAVELAPADVQNCYALLHGQEMCLETTKKTLDQTKRTVNSVITTTGLGAGDENISPVDNTTGQR